jgi:hypothetical protein
MGHIACMGEMRNAYKILVRRPKETFGRPRHGWEDNFKMSLTGNKVVGWTELTQNRIK